jgi:hypothetical protein
MIRWNVLIVVFFFTSVERWVQERGILMMSDALRKPLHIWQYMTLSLWMKPLNTRQCLTALRQVLYRIQSYRGVAHFFHKSDKYNLPNSGMGPGWLFTPTVQLWFLSRRISAVPLGGETFVDTWCGLSHKCGLTRCAFGKIWLSIEFQKILDTCSRSRKPTVFITRLFEYLNSPINWNQLLIKWTWLLINWTSPDG